MAIAKNNETEANCTFGIINNNSVHSRDVGGDSYQRKSSFKSSHESTAKLALRKVSEKLTNISLSRPDINVIIFDDNKSLSNESANKGQKKISKESDLRVKNSTPREKELESAILEQPESQSSSK